MSMMSASEDSENLRAPLADLPASMLISIIQALPYEDLVLFVDLLLSSDHFKEMWHSQKMSTNLSCNALNNREYTTETLQWVLDRGINIRNFSLKMSISSPWEVRWDPEGAKYVSEGAKYRECTFYDACALSRNSQVVKAYIEFNDADVNAPNKDGQTPLRVACDRRRGDLEVVKALLAAGAGESINKPDKHGVTPLTSACDGGHLEVVKALLAAGASIHLPDLNGDTPLISACDGGHLEVVEILLAAGAGESINVSRKYALIEEACFNESVQMVHMLLEVGPAEWLSRDEKEYLLTMLRESDSNDDIVAVLQNVAVKE